MSSMDQGVCVIVYHIKYHLCSSYFLYLCKALNSYNYGIVMMYRTAYLIGSNGVRVGPLNGDITSNGLNTL
jgi:hypothetical protein